MKYLREILLCVVLTAACSVATLHGGDSLSLKIMTYNLRFGEKASLEELAEAIRAQRPDLVALQEIDCRTRRPGVERQHDKDFVTELGLRTGMFPLYGKTIPHAGGWYGIGILTAGPYISVQKLMLPQASATEEPRALLLATIEAGGDTIVFASTHLSLSAQSRRMQAEFIAREIGSLRFPALLGGDFNAGPNAPEIETMTRWNRLGSFLRNFPTIGRSFRSLRRYGERGKSPGTLFGSGFALETCRHRHLNVNRVETVKTE